MTTRAVLFRPSTAMVRPNPARGRAEACRNVPRGHVAPLPPVPGVVGRRRLLAEGTAPRPLRMGVDLPPQVGPSRPLHQSHVGIPESRKRVRAIQQGLHLHLHGRPPGGFSPDGHTHREPVMPAMFFPSFAASSGRGSGGVAGDGHQRCAAHRRVTTTISRGGNQPRQDRSPYRFSPTDCAEEPSFPLTVVFSSPDTPPQPRGPASRVPRQPQPGRPPGSRTLAPPEEARSRRAPEKQIPISRRFMGSGAPRTREDGLDARKGHRSLVHCRTGRRHDRGRWRREGAVAARHDDRAMDRVA